MADPRTPIESGAPDPMPYMHPVMVKNYGKWNFHSHPKPGVLYHRAVSGDEIWTVKAGTARQMDHYTIRELAEAVIAQTGSRSRLVTLPLPADDPTQRKPDTSLAQAQLGGWAPTPFAAAYTASKFGLRGF